MKVFGEYKKLYTSCNRMGEATILSAYLGFEEESFLPLSIAHGVDFGHLYKPMDINNLEPVHWAYNEIIKKGCLGSKPYVSAPHPWAILAAQEPPSSGTGTLIIGPPPGPRNDGQLYALIANRVRSEECHILVKAKGNYKPSFDFWLSKGVKPVSVGGRSEDFYHSLLDIVGRYERVIGCTFSSALIFAASICKKVDVINDFSYEFYDVGDYLDRVNFHSEVSRGVVRDFICGNYDKKVEIARWLLGFDLLGDKGAVEASMREAFSRCFPVWLDGQHGLRQRLMLELARITGRPGLVRASLADTVGRLAGIQNRKISIVRMNEIKVWLEGLDHETFSIRSVPFEKDVTIPGLSVDQY